MPLETGKITRNYLGKLHIAIDASRLAVAMRTGTEHYTYELLAALAHHDRWNRYTLYCNQAPTELPPLGPNVTLRRIPFPRLWTHARLSAEILRHPPDVLFIPAHVLPLGAPLLRKTRTIVTVHDLGYLHFPDAHTRAQRLYLRLSTLWSARAATHLIAISSATRDDLVRFAGISPHKITVVHHGLSPRFRPVNDHDRIAEVQARYCISAPYFLYVGTVQPRKNLERLINAFARLHRGSGVRGQGSGVRGQGSGVRGQGSARDRQPAPALERSEGTDDRRSAIDEEPRTTDQGQLTGDNLQSPISNLQLVLAGKRGWLSESIERRAEALGIADRIRFTGYVDDTDLPALLSGACAFVFPSLYEGFGMPVLEAMACGSPVLTANTSSLPEVAGDAALLVDPEDTGAIAAGLMRLLEDANLRADLQGRGLAQAERFTWGRCAVETLAVLHNRNAT
jgi:glycosyltransferase involved in cell wall biosynthesis